MAKTRLEREAFSRRRKPNECRWLSTNEGQPLVGHPRIKPGETFIASEVFSANLEALSAYLRTTNPAR